MSWISELVKTYDNNAHLAGRDDVTGMKYMLPPVGHIVQNAQIEVTLDGKGKFLYASVLPKKPKEAQQTLIPCTINSASRTHFSPHPLHDQIAYVARDYGDYIALKNGEESPYKQYVALLGAWVKSKYSSSKLEAVYQYTSNNDLIHNLLTHRILFADSSGQIINKWTYKDVEKPAIYSAVSGDVLKAFVRFRVEDGDGCPDLWRDQELQKKWFQFFLEYSSDVEKRTCYATGKQSIIADKHSKGIRFAGDKAKIISSNDTEGLTYRGRFANAIESLSISYEASQKAMNALMWLIRNQGYIVDGCVFLAWGANNVATMDVFEGSSRMLARRLKQEEALPNTMQDYAKTLNSLLHGKTKELQRAEDSKVNIMVLDALTDGRLSICCYNELAENEFVERILRWHKKSAWMQHGWDKDKKQFYSYIGVPSPQKLLEVCYGEHVSDKQEKLQLKRIFQSIVNGTPLPADIEKSAVIRTVRCAGADGVFEWKRNCLEPTCSIIANRSKEEWSLALNAESHERSYLFGRLLAAADQMERMTYTFEERKKRITTAMRYMMAFSMRPSSTWLEIQKRLLPYQLKREEYGGKERRLIAQIADLFEGNDFASNKPLDSSFLLGFYSQQQVFDVQREEAKRKRLENKNVNEEQENV